MTYSTEEKNIVLGYTRRAMTDFLNCVKNAYMVVSFNTAIHKLVLVRLFVLNLTGTLVIPSI